MKSKKNPEFRFCAELVKEESGIGFHYIEFPHNVEKIFGKKGAVRVVIHINGESFRRALIPQASGLHKIIIGGEIRKKTGIACGDQVEIMLHADPDPLPVQIPEELESVFEMEPDIRNAFEQLAPGMKRNICTWVSEGKKIETRVKRALEVLNRFQSGKFHFGGQSVNK